MAENSNSPLVSVLCRSMNRPQLAEALESVSRQIYNNIEIILVDATGKGLDAHRNLSIRFPVTEVGEGRPLNRPTAANLALQNANGCYLIFLDEDDWIGVDHISQLVEALETRPDIGVVYSSTLKTLASGAATEEIFQIPYDPVRLRRDNFIPIHAALFRKTLLADGACFDESLEIFEDWDFWLQLATRTEFLHIDSLTAFYREGGESNTANADPMMRYRAGHAIADGRERVFDKWLPAWKGRDLNQVLGNLDQSVLLQTLHNELSRLNSLLRDAEQRRHGAEQETARLNNEIRTLNHTLYLTVKKLNHNISRKNAELQETRAQIDHLAGYIQMLQGSLSWRVTRPLRWLRRKIVNEQNVRPGGLLHAEPSSSEQDPPSRSASPIEGSLDTPNASQNELPEQVSLRGWCCSPNGIDRIEALVDDQLMCTFHTGISRPDIAELYPDFPGAVSSGFHQDIALPDLAAGEHTLELRFIDKAGQKSTLRRQFSHVKNNELYNSWYWRSMPDEAETSLLRINAKAANSSSTPGLNLLIVDVGDEAALLATLSSLTEQVWPHWIIHIQGPRLSGIDNFMQINCGDDRQIHWHESLHDALTVLETSSGWTAFLQAGETLAPHALAEFMQLARTQDLHLIYSDHDETDPSGSHLKPVFTPQWSPEHLLSSNYIGGFYVFRNEHLHRWRELNLLLPAWRYAVLLMLADIISEVPCSVQRIAKVLWSSPEGANTPTHLACETEVLGSHLSRTHPDAKVMELKHDLRAVLWPLSSTPKVSIIIPTMGKLALVKPCIDSLLEKTSYPDFEVIILDNGRGKFPEGIQYLKDLQLKVVECNEPFNWARLNNTGVRHSSGELLLFLNDDIEITSGEWLEHLVRQALRPQNGAIGALLYYPNGALQHTGVLLVNYGGGGVHLLHKRMPDSRIYRNLHETVREVSANTGACLMVSREKFQEIQGFDEELAVVGNDVDLCLRLLDRGYRNIWTPLCHLIHHESISRKNTVPKEDEKAMWQRWSKRFVAGDDYYNPNLSTDQADFTLQLNNLRVRNTAADNTEITSGNERLLPGVNLIGYTRAEMGIGEGARSDARALNAAHEPFGIICFISGNPSRMTDLSWQHKEIDTAPYDITLLHINPDHALQALNELPSSHFDGHYAIGYWAWELPEIPEDWEKAFKYFDEIWVPSSFVQDAVAMKSPIPVVRIPHAIEVKVDETFNRTSFNLPEHAFLFLIMFDIYSTQERKNPLGAIESFRNAFEPEDMSVRLVIKINNSTADTLLALRERIGSHKNILLLDQIYSRKAVNAIIANCDCFVSLHRSEGFGFGPAEAMALGKAVIATNWSGNTDYMRPDNSIGIDYQLTAIQSDHGPYKKGQIWAEPDLDQAALAMKRLVADKDMTLRLGMKAKETIDYEFSPTAVGMMMRKRLAAIRTLRAGFNDPDSI